MLLTNPSILYAVIFISSVITLTTANHSTLLNATDECRKWLLSHGITIGKYALIISLVCFCVYIARSEYVSHKQAVALAAYKRRVYVTRRRRLTLFNECMKKKYGGFNKNCRPLFKGTDLYGDSEACDLELSQESACWSVVDSEARLPVN